MEIEELSTGVKTRAAAERCEAEMRPLRVQLEQQFEESQRLRAEKEADLLALTGFAAARSSMRRSAWVAANDCGFAAFLASSDGVQPMGALSGAQRRKAGKANGELMQALRGKLSAHAKGLLPWEYARLPEFTADPSDATAPVYIELDEDE